jgi:hypothetical protein
MTADESSRIKNALELAMRYGGIDGDHHQKWLVDQMVRALTGCPLVKGNAVDYEGVPYEYVAQGESEEYRQWVKEAKDGDAGPDTYDWDEGIPP